MGDYYLQAVLVRKPISFEDAKGWSQHFIKNYKRTYYTETAELYTFKNLAKVYFVKESLKFKKINDIVTLVYGTLRAENNDM
jgi:hypothetical protein